MFLSPIFLIAAAVGATIPMFLHLMQSRRKVTRHFPTLRFLKVANKSSSSRVRLENFLLWLLRTLIMLLLGVAFSMPMLRKSTLSWIGNAPRDVAIIIDASASMNYLKNGKPVWDLAVETASGVIEGLNEKDRVCLFSARNQPEALIVEPISDKTEVLTRIKSLAPGSTASRLGPAIEETIKALKKSDENREMEIHIITDNQALPWNGLSADDSSKKSPLAELEKATVFVTLLGVDAPENLAPSGLTIQPSRLQSGVGAKLTTAFSRTGPSGSSTAILTLNGKEAGRRSIKLGDNTAESVEFLIPPLESGIHTGSITTPGDNLAADNSFHFVLNVGKSRPCLVVGEPSDTLFVETALKTGMGNPNATVRVSPADLAKAPLADHSCIILCNALPLSGQALAALDSHVKAGGVLVLFPGTKGSPLDYKALPFLPAFPSTLANVPPTKMRKTITWDKPTHPLIQPLREGSGSPSISLRRYAPMEKIEPGAEILASLGAGEPFLLEKPHGKGKILQFTVAADRSTSDFALSPFFLPLLVQCADYSSPPPLPFIEGTDSLVLNEIVPGLSVAPTITGPGGITIPVRGNTDGLRTIFLVEKLFSPGVYNITLPGESAPRAALAVNTPADEGNLSRIAPGEIPARLGVDSTKVARDITELRRQLEESRVGRTFGEQILWLVLILAAVEFFYANALSRRGASAKDRVELDHSGHIKKEKKTVAA